MLPKYRACMEFSATFASRDHIIIEKCYYLCLWMSGRLSFPPTKNENLHVANMGEKILF